MSDRTGQSQPVKSQYQSKLDAAFGEIPPFAGDRSVALQSLLNRGRLETANRHRDRWAMAVQASAFAASYILASLLPFTGGRPAGAIALALTTLPGVIAIKAVVFGLMGSHRDWWRTATFTDFVALTEATALATISIIVIDLLVATATSIPGSILALDCVVTLCLVGCLRGGMPGRRRP